MDPLDANMTGTVWDPMCEYKFVGIRPLMIPVNNSPYIINLKRSIFLRSVAAGSDQQTMKKRQKKIRTNSIYQLLLPVALASLCV